MVFSAIDRMNEMREECYNTNYASLKCQDGDLPYLDSAKAWLGHKALTVLSTPVKALIIGSSNDTS
jgi:hypothetical protein